MIKDGILNINKPADWTSHDAVKLLRRVTGQKRIGHTGTLDPMATGVLPICFGPATRIMEYLDLDFKKYRCSLRLGIETDTLDIWGEVLKESSFDQVTEHDIHKAFEEFKGNISQNRLNTQLSRLQAVNFMTMQDQVKMLKSSREKYI